MRLRSTLFLAFPALWVGAGCGSKTSGAGGSGGSLSSTGGSAGTTGAQTSSTGGIGTSGTSGTGTGTSGTVEATTGGVDGGTTTSSSSGSLCAGKVHTLLVDNDDSDNNNNVSPAVPSASDLIVQAVLTDAGIPFATYVVPGGMVSNQPPARPSSEDLAACQVVLWYTGGLAGTRESNASPMSLAQDGALVSWVNGGQRSLFLFSEGLLADLLQPVGPNAWNGVPDEDPLLPLIAGQDGGGFDADSNPKDILPTGTPVAWAMTGFRGTWNIVNGGNGTPAWGVPANAPLNYPTFSTLGLVNPASSTIDYLATVQAIDPSGGVATTAVITGNRHAGAAGSSIVVFVGFPIEDYLPQAAATATPYDLFSALNEYVVK